MTGGFRTLSGNRLRRAERIRGKRNFALFAKARHYRGNLIRIAAVPSDSGLKVAFVVSKKVSPKAVERNRLKRRLKELYKKCRHLLPQDAQLMIMAMADARYADFQALHTDLEKLFKKITPKNAGHIRH